MLDDELGNLPLQITACIRFLRNSGALTSIEFGSLKPAFFEAVADALKNRDEYRFERWHLRRASLLTVSGHEVNVVLAVDSKLKVKPGLKVFVGHRFNRRLTDSLRYNLQTILQPYGIQTPFYADWEVHTGPLLSGILPNIKDADFCIFDDRETEARPNVLIELGFAIALERPCVYFLYKNKRQVLVDGKEEKIDVPADLMGLIRHPYDDYEFRSGDGYEDLFPTFARNLPKFLLSHNLAGRQ